MASVLLLTPQIEEEAEGVLDAFGRGAYQPTDVRVGRMTCTVIPELDTLVAVGGNGKAQFAVQAQYLLDRCPDDRKHEGPVMLTSHPPPQFTYRWFSDVAARHGSRNAR